MINSGSGNQGITVSVPVIENAKALLMERNKFSEEEAHRYIQKRSMENGTGLVEVSQMILSLMREG